MVEWSIARFQKSERVRSLATGRTGVIQSVDVRSRTRITVYQVRLDHPSGVLLEYPAEELASMEEQAPAEGYGNETGSNSVDAKEERGD